MKDLPSLRRTASDVGFAAVRTVPSAVRAALTHALAGLGIVGLAPTPEAAAGPVSQSVHQGSVNILNRDEKLGKLVFAVGAADHGAYIAHRSHRSHSSHRSHYSHSSSAGSYATRPPATPVPQSQPTPPPSTTNAVSIELTIVAVDIEKRTFSVKSAAGKTALVHYRDDTKISFPSGLTYRLDEVLEEYRQPLPFEPGKRVRVVLRTSESTDKLIANEVKLLQ